MSKVTHTPGPWIWGPDFKGLYGAGPDNDVLHHESYEGMWLAYGSSRLANANLIAAAPDLLRVCRGLIAVIDAGIPDPVDIDLYQQALEVIADATRTAP